MYRIVMKANTVSKGKAFSHREITPACLARVYKSTLVQYRNKMRDVLLNPTPTSGYQSLLPYLRECRGDEPAWE